MNIIAFIPLRGSSKSIPKKNIKNIAGKPLFAWVLQPAIDCDEIDQVIVSTEDDEIKRSICDNFQDESKLIVHNRSKTNAGDESSTESVMIEYAIDNHFNHVVLIQATSPLLNVNDLSSAIKTYRKSKANGLLSVVRQKRFLWETDLDADSARPLNYNYLNRPRRQEFGGYLVENGAFYITSRNKLLQSGCRLSKPVILHEMSEDTYFEIDEPTDWIIVEKLLERKRKSKLNVSIPEKLKRVKLFITDVDGVLTDAGMYYSERGDELKKFNTRDGKGLELLRKAGVLTGIMTSENTKLVNRRARKLNVDFLYQGMKDKVDTFRDVLSKTGLTADQVAYIGDDLNDLSVIEKVGVSACPGDATESVKGSVDIVLTAKGGNGCVREFAELILKYY